MPKFLKSGHLNDELWAAEQALNKKEIDEKGLLKIIAKIQILIAKIIRDMKHNQVAKMKKDGVALIKPSKKKDKNNDENK